MIKVKIASWESWKSGIFECEEIRTESGLLYVERSDLPKLFVDLPNYVRVNGIRHEVFPVAEITAGLYRLI